MGLFKKKDPIVEVEKALDHEVHEMEHDIQADVDAVMKKYDRESNTRIWEGAPKIALQVLMSAFSIYCILMTLFSKALPERRLSLFLGFIIIIGYLVYPARKGAARVNHVPWYDWLLMVLGAGSFFYFAINAFSIIQLATKLQPVHIIVGAIGIVVLIELCRRCVGLPILVVLGLLLIYTFYNQLSWDPSFYKALKNIVYKLFYTTSGVIGTPVSVCYTYIVLFIIFGAFLERTGIANFFISFANRLAGWSSGGPAKVAVLASGFLGSINGSAVANVVTTGTFTIPLMKRLGYPATKAAAIEVASSVNGQLAPPVMGAAAFILAEMTGIPLGTLSKLLAGISDSPKLSNIVAISEALDCSLDYLITGVPRNTNNCTLSEDELIFIGNYRLLDGYGRSLVDAVVNMEVDRAIRQQTDDAHRNVSPQGDAGEQAAYPASAARHRTLRGGQNELSATAPAEPAAVEPGTASLLHLPGGHGRKDTAKRRRITLYDLPVSAGIGEFLSDAHATEISIPDVAQTVDADFALRIAGNSMEPNYHDGDILLVRRTESVTPGELGIFVLDGCGYFKKFDGDRLLSLNPAYPPILLKNFTQTACCGQVIGRMRKR